MKMSLHELDAEVAEIEVRIAAERVALDNAIDACTNGLRDAVASPKTLLALTGVGFAVGKLMFGRHSAQQVPEAKKTGWLGMVTGVAGAALGLMQPRLGLASVARWAASKYFSGKKPKSSPAPNRAPTRVAGTPTPPRATVRAP